MLYGCNGEVLSFIKIKRKLAFSMLLSMELTSLMKSFITLLLDMFFWGMHTFFTSMFFHAHLWYAYYLTIQCNLPQYNACTTCINRIIDYFNLFNFSSIAFFCFYILSHINLAVFVCKLYSELWLKIAE